MCLSEAHQVLFNSHNDPIFFHETKIFQSRFDLHQIKSETFEWCKNFLVMDIFSSLLYNNRNIYVWIHVWLQDQGCDGHRTLLQKRLFYQCCNCITHTHRCQDKEDKSLHQSLSLFQSIIMYTNYCILGKATPHCASTLPIRYTTLFFLSLLHIVWLQKDKIGKTFENPFFVPWKIQTKIKPIFFLGGGGGGKIFKDDSAFIFMF